MIMDPGSSRDLNKSPLPDDPDSRPLFFMGEDVLVRTGFPQGELKIYGEDGKRIILGVCAMPKKSNSKPMREILDRLEKFMHIQTLIFEEDVILNEDVENWPVVDVLISFFSTGFPLDKAIAYKNLRNPFVINDLESQQILQDRREVYKILVNEGISHPRYAVCDRTVNCSPTCGIQKQCYSQYSRVRKKGSYIYEEFMPTDGTDVKVYTVGPDYAHAEARKSPALDGKVERDKNGKEVRYPVLLSAKEKLLARKVCLAFKNNDYATMIMRALAPQLHIPWVLGSAPEDIPVVPTTSGSMYGHFSGINRKVQLKYQPYGHPKKSSSEEGV
ncbi:hypothetical protein KUTeg_010902 [Tegillarca granosa]|uniref:VIP1 N-terminal domain-containing protein n=1 Tax=Tegillarca granosa TaxID=220873 RepID=A0ABQ9F6P9_TEGGR|nr:hypothetical protein KUTeg_010902 [Tegillarca granosa]